MKILSLRLKNINSLKGEWKIDFTAEPFASNGLFAITGPTGAGKNHSAGRYLPRAVSRNAASEQRLAIAKRSDDPRYRRMSGGSGI
ncbi:Nuclease sbcCD subunit C [Raoultella planticola]|nr:Nuclease sbcCD subunit C [Raoultella planticola]